MIGKCQVSTVYLSPGIESVNCRPCKVDTRNGNIQPSKVEITSGNCLLSTKVLYIHVYILINGIHVQVRSHHEVKQQHVNFQQLQKKST
jgi:cell division protein FtsB